MTELEPKPKPKPEPEEGESIADYFERINNGESEPESDPEPDPYAGIDGGDDVPSPENIKKGSRIW